MKKRVWGLVGCFVAGGFLGRELERRHTLGIPLLGEAKAAQPPRIPQIMRYGFPSNTNIKERGNYVLSYDRRNRNPNWVFEHLTKDIVAKTEDSADRTNINFIEDQTIPKIFRSTNRDYLNSGYDRGHMAAAANHRADQYWMEETFLLSNISPQHPHFNRNAWNNLERYVRSLAFHYENVYVCTGPLYLPMRMPDGKSYVTYEVLEPNHVAVPTHFFKVVLLETGGDFALRSYVMPNREVDPSTPLREFEQPIEAIEKSAGLLFLSGLPSAQQRNIVQNQSRRLRAF
uniref:Endonuclease n=1 Tax=Phallusia mammillata TaxID=59560 RepID=A0A6F9DBD1_9ASCI|nr:endonuclease G, mitochondrial-like [Phallusia mammillata]